ncbi:MAG: relaxase/mobilization nuclease domain-containing protein [Sphingobacteriaceae bacterium]|nr:relaxase/mobilization nuclease domain-containing protein [Sphingobacteriaceae bacterium]
MTYICDTKKDAEIISASVSLFIPHSFDDKEDMSFMINQFMREYQQKIEIENHKVKEPLAHHRISFAGTDDRTLSKAEKKIIVEDYIQQRGLENTKWIAVEHNDTEHKHIHLVFSRIGFDLKLIHENDFERNTELAYKMAIKHNIQVTDNVEIEYVKQILPKRLKKAENFIVFENLCSKIGLKIIINDTDIVLKGETLHRVIDKKSLERIFIHNQENKLKRKTKKPDWELKQERKNERANKTGEKSSSNPQKKELSLRELLPLPLRTAKNEHHLVKKLAVAAKIEVVDLGNSLKIENKIFSKSDLQLFYKENRIQKNEATLKDKLPITIKNATSLIEFNQLFSMLPISAQHVVSSVLKEHTQIELDTMFDENSKEFKSLIHGSETEIDLFLNESSEQEIITKLHEESEEIDDDAFEKIMFKLDESFLLEDVMEGLAELLNFDRFIFAMQNMPNVMNRGDTRSNEKSKKRTRKRTK